jgi:hypothetical protein
MAVSGGSLRVTFVRGFNEIHFIMFKGGRGAKPFFPGRAGANPSRNEKLE